MNESQTISQCLMSFSCLPGCCAHGRGSAIPKRPDELTSKSFLEVSPVGLHVCNLSRDLRHKLAHTMDAPQKPHDFKLLNIIGSGCNNTATVAIALHIPSGTYVAVKRINLEHCEVAFSLIQLEAHMHKMIVHDNVLPSHASFVHENEVWICLPLMGYGSCRDLIHAHFTEGLPELAIAYILHSVLQALEHIHAKGIIHRSVRASHIMVSSDGDVRLSGLRHCFSMVSAGKRAKAVHEFPSHYVNDLLWASPELLEQNLAGYDMKSDVYSVGITACELANGVVPFTDLPATQMLLEKIEGSMPRLLDSRTIPELNLDQAMDLEETQNPSDPAEEGTSQHASSVIPYHRTFSHHFHNLVELCLQTDPAHRPSATSLLQHSFFKQLKRKGPAPRLPDLLKPVQPLTSIDLPEDAAEVEDLTEGLQSVDIADINKWDF